MRIEQLTKDELVSHTAEIVATQDATIDTLKSEKQVLQVIALVLLSLWVAF
jgi:hypothetical protein